MTSDSYATSVSGPGALVTAIPALLGFVPERSLVLITFSGDGDEIGTTMRHDLSLQPDGVPTATMLGVIGHLARVCESYRVDRVIAVIIDDTRASDDGAYRRLAAIIDQNLYGVGGLHGALPRRQFQRVHPGRQCGTVGPRNAVLNRSPPVWSVTP